MQPKAIAIIGAGFSGAMVAVHLLRSATQPLTVVLIDPQPKMGQGVAYGTPWPCHRLNVPVGKMSAFPAEPDHFVRWIERQPDWHHPRSAQAFAPRPLYGQYIQAVLAEAEALAPPHVRLVRRVDDVVAVTPHGSKAIVWFNRSDAIAVDRVVLALGNFPASPLPLADMSFDQRDRYLHDPWHSGGSIENQNDAAVLLIGSGLTAIDMVMTLQQQGHCGQIHMVSRRGLLPQAHALPTPQPALAANLPKSTQTDFSRLSLQPSRWTSINTSTNTSTQLLDVPTSRLLNPPPLPANLTLRQLVRQLRRSAQLATAQGQDWRSVIDSLRPQTQTLWQQLSGKERQQFLRHLRPYWDTHRHRIAPAIASQIAQLRQTGQLTVQAGRILAYTEDADAVEVTIRQRCSSVTRLRVARVVNCTGPERNYQRVQNPLVKTLLQSTLIQPDPLGLGLQVAANGAMIQADATPSTWLYTLGAARTGSLWETTAVPELRCQAIALAQELLHPGAP